MGEGTCNAIPEPAAFSTFQDVSIKRVENGWIVKVGCKTFVEKEWENISVGLKEYFENPTEAQKKYCGGK